MKKKQPTRNQRGECSKAEFIRLWNVYRVKHGEKPILYLNVSGKRYL